jgi:hypothetical protein
VPVVPIAVALRDRAVEDGRSGERLVHELPTLSSFATFT